MHVEFVNATWIIYTSYSTRKTKMPNSDRFFLTSPHSGESVPNEIFWLNHLPENILMFDVDRFVDQLYRPVAQKLDLKFIESKWHRYFSDANRFPEDIDKGSVEGAPHPEGVHLTGMIWQKTSQGHILLKEPISQDLHQLIVEKYYSEFHDSVKRQYSDYFAQSSDPVFQLDLHSMPSQGTSIHKDPGETRAEIVISDQEGKSASGEYVQLVIDAYEKAGFAVVKNWPYVGGRVTQIYGQPKKNQNCVQVELRRDLYMNEETKKMKPEAFAETTEKLSKAIEWIKSKIDLIV